MKIAIIGYGKMGRLIHEICESRGHEIVSIIDAENSSEVHSLSELNTEVAIEFTGPETAFSNICACLEQHIPIVSGSTGWLDREKEVLELCNQKKGTFFYASNFSLGVNLFFKLNRQLAKLMDEYPEYEGGIREIHHIHKKDSPSGTAITLAEGIVHTHHRYKTWAESSRPEHDELPIEAVREGEVPGTHIVGYTSDEDRIEIKHEAFGRKGFATGAVRVAEWVSSQTGILSMDDFLDR